MVHACDFGQKMQRGATPCKTDFRAKRASVPDLAHVQENWAKTWCAHVILAQKTQRGATLCKMDFRAKRASVPDLAHVQLTLLMYMKTGRKHGRLRTGTDKGNPTV